MKFIKFSSIKESLVLDDGCDRFAFCTSNSS